MKKRIVDLVFILDASGSMSSLTASTIKGFNDMLNTQKEALMNDDVLVTTVTFNTSVKYLSFCERIENIEPLTCKTYYANGCTALNDAVGSTINRVSENQTQSKKKSAKRKTIVVITTDGYENASKEYTRAHICDLIKNKKELGWEFIFMGAGIDAETEGAALSIDRENCFATEHSDDGILRQMSYACCRIMDLRDNSIQDLPKEDENEENFSLRDFLKEDKT